MTRKEELIEASCNQCGELVGRDGEITMTHVLKAFKMGAKWAETHPVNPWHKASEELPTHFGDYLVIIKSQQFGRRCALKCWYGHPKDPFGDNPSKEWVLEDDEIVTHWMEIPEIPKEEGK